MQRLDVDRVRRLVRDEDPPGGTVDPAEGRDAVGRPVQDPHLAGGRRRRQRGGPLHELVAAVADPPRQGGQGAAHDAPLEHREGHAVELHEQDAGHLRVRDRLAPSRAAHEVGEDGVVGARRHHPRGQRGDAGHDPGRPEGVEERVDRTPGTTREGEVGHDRLTRAGPAPGRRPPRGVWLRRPAPAGSPVPPRP